MPKDKSEHILSKLFKVFSQLFEIENKCNRIKCNKCNK